MVKKKYQEGEKTVGPSQKRLFYKPEVIRCQSSLRSLKNWLHSVNIAQEVLAKQLKKMRMYMCSFQSFGLKVLPPVI